MYNVPEFFVSSVWYIDSYITKSDYENFEIGISNQNDISKIGKSIVDYVNSNKHYTLDRCLVYIETNDDSIVKSIRFESEKSQIRSLVFISDDDLEYMREYLKNKANQQKNEG